MAVTRSWTTTGAVAVAARRKGAPRIGWLVGASLVVATGLAAVYTAKVQRLVGQPLNVNAVTSAEELRPLDAELAWGDAEAFAE